MGMKADYLATVLFLLAVTHTFVTPLFNSLAQKSRNHAGLFHLLGEVEVVFGLWALVFLLANAARNGVDDSVRFLESVNFTEPAFVFVIMALAATKPVLSLTGGLLNAVAGILPMPRAQALYLVTLSLCPLLGSLVTEPAAMTICAMTLAASFYVHQPSRPFRYGTLAVLFVNVSIGGVLTHYAAPPVVMVAAKWGWGTNFMLTHFGYKAALAVALNALAATVVFRREISDLGRMPSPPKTEAAPLPVILAHLSFLALVVYFAHHPIVFIAVFLAAIGFMHAYEKHQEPLLLRSSLLVALFLAGLVVLGAKQQWWLEDVLASMDTLTLFWGSAGLTAITDNAALTYLGSLVTDLSPEAKHALLAGAVTGGGLTVIANAPNPAGYAILKDNFTGGTIAPGRLFLYALVPTLVAASCMLLLPNL